MTHFVSISLKIWRAIWYLLSATVPLIMSHKINDYFFYIFENNKFETSNKSNRAEGTPIDTLRNSILTFCSPIILCATWNAKFEHLCVPWAYFDFPIFKIQNVEKKSFYIKCSTGSEWCYTSLLYFFFYFEW